MVLSALAIMILAVLLGLAMALLTLPGVWLMLLVAMLLQWWSIAGTTPQVIDATLATVNATAAVPTAPLFSWWTLGACFALAVLGEILEAVASAATTRTAGGSKTSAALSIVGGLLGAIVGTAFVPPLGTLVGGVIGAGAGAVLGEKAIKKKDWDASLKAGAGAAVGRVLATIIKIFIALTVGASLLIAVIVA
jgi:uncharacterized protein YqgC (DUF456 family)